MLVVCGALKTAVIWPVLAACKNVWFFRCSTPAVNPHFIRVSTGVTWSWRLHDTKSELVVADKVRLESKFNSLSFRCTWVTEKFDEVLLGRRQEVFTNDVAPVKGRKGLTKSGGHWRRKRAVNNYHLLFHHIFYCWIQEKKLSFSIFCMKRYWHISKISLSVKIFRWRKRGITADFYPTRDIISKNREYPSFRCTGVQNRFVWTRLVDRVGGYKNLTSFFGIWEG